MSELTIVHLDRATIGPNVEVSRPDCAHSWISYEATAAEDVVERLREADIAILNKVSLNAEQIAQLPRLKMVAISATGYDKIDIAACKAAGITVSNIRGYASETVPEHTFALILALHRALKGYEADLAKGAWQASGQFCFFTHKISDLYGKTLGLIGSGSIGAKVGKIAEAFGMHILRAGRKGESHVPEGYVPFHDMLAEADIISLHCPLTPATQNLIAAPEFAQMTRRPLIINTARGGLVHEADLITALDTGQISGAGFDVLTSEPPADDHILMQNLHRPNLIVTPHIGWASDEAMQTLWHQLIGHIEAFVAGSPRYDLTAELA